MNRTDAFALPSDAISSAYALILDIDEGLALAFLNQPLNRMTLISALHHGMKQCNLAPMADEVAVFLRSAVDQDRLALQVTP